MITPEEHRAAVATLPEELRRTYERFVNGERYRTIAEALGVTVNTVAPPPRAAPGDAP